MYISRDFIPIFHLIYLNKSNIVKICSLFQIIIWFVIKIERERIKECRILFESDKPAGGWG